MLARKQWLQRIIGGTWMERFGLGALSRVQESLLTQHKNPEAVRLVKRVRRERRSLLTAYELFTIYSMAGGCRSLGGELVEVGVFQGSSARLLCEVKGQCPLHLFDTFEGLPASAAEDGGVHRENQYACSLESVKSYLAGFENVRFYKGRFPDGTDAIADRRFAFAHFDVDLYESTRDCLEFFYPRMLPGGVMLSHDYSVLAGVRQAVDEFLSDKREHCVELPSTQCMIIKLPD